VAVVLLLPQQEVMLTQAAVLRHLTSALFPLQNLKTRIVSGLL
jgi:hypothetical protein